MQNNIPKIIHFCWFGKDDKGNRNKKPQIVLDCIESWQKHMPDYKIIEWSEDNFDPYSHPYTKLAYNNKKWAFVTDYVRLFALQKYGGVYLDTDMYITKSLNTILNHDLVLGKEDKYFISAGMIASKTNNVYIKSLLDDYQNKNILEPIPKMLTNTYNQLLKDDKLGKIDMIIFDSVNFYPFNADNIKEFKYENINWTNNAPKESYGVHLWNYSWGHPLNKFIKKTGLHKILKNILEKLGIKTFIKNILKME